MTQRAGRRYSGAGLQEVFVAGAGRQTWMTAPVEEALKLQRPLPDGSLKIVATGVMKDEAA